MSVAPIPIPEPIPGQIPGPGFLPPAAYSYLDRSAETLSRAIVAETSCARYDLAYVSAIRAVAALLAVRVDPHRRRSARQRSAWEALARVAPEFSEWATFFSACTTKRLAAEIGLPGAVTTREADDLLREADHFLMLIESALGLSTGTRLAAGFAAASGSAGSG